MGQDLPGLDVRDGSLDDVTDFAQGFVRLLLSLGWLAVGRFFVRGGDSGSDASLTGDAAGGSDPLEHPGGRDGPGVAVESWALAGRGSEAHTA